MALPTNRRASAVGVTTVKAPIAVGAQLREEITLILAQAATGTAAGSLDMPVEVFANTDLNSLLGVGIGSPVNLAKEAFFKAEQGLKLWVLPVGDPVAGAAATGDIEAATGTATKSIIITVEANGYTASGSIPTGADQDDAAELIQTLLNSITRNPFTTNIDTGVTDNVVDLTAVCKGEIGNEIHVDVYDDAGKPITAAEYGIEITVTEMAGGAGDSATATALENIPETLKVTRIITHFDDTTTLDALKQLADDRNTPELGEIIRAYRGERVNSATTATINSEYTRIVALADARINDDVNAILPTDNNGLAIEFVAEVVGRAAARYTVNPGKPPRGIVAEFNSSQSRSNYWFSSTQRDAMYKKGISNFEKQWGYLKLFDLCCIYHPTNDNILSENPPVQFNDEDSTAIGNMQYSIIQTFKSPLWEAVKFVSNTDVTSNSAARKLIDVAAQIDVLVTSWLGFLFVKDIANTKLTKTVKFNDSNPERVDMVIPVTLASTGRIYDVILSATKANR
jgi:phage tail sheath gpL-like